MKNINIIKLLKSGGAGVVQAILDKTIELERQSIALNVCLHEFNVNEDQELELIKHLSKNVENLSRELKDLVEGTQEEVQEETQEKAGLEKKIVPENNVKKEHTEKEKVA